MNKEKLVKLVKRLIPVGLGSLLWYLPAPLHLSIDGWHAFALFLSTIIGIVLNPQSMVSISLSGVFFAVLFHMLSLKDVAIGFTHEVVWLIVSVFLIARGVISSGLGNRLAYGIMKFLGDSSLGLGYGIVATNFLMSPSMPSVTARAGGIIYPMIRSIASIFTGGVAHDPRMGAFLTLCAYQSMGITSAMFLTAMAGNPLIAVLAKQNDITIRWIDWAFAALIPGLISLILLPYIIYRFWPPTSQNTPHVRKLACEQLEQMGPMSLKEKSALATMLLLIGLWIVGPHFGLRELYAALLGVGVLLITRTLTLKDLVREKIAWETLFWFAPLIMLASLLNRYGFSSYFSHSIGQWMNGWHWGWGLLILSLIYFYSHYFFASAIAHIGAMYGTFLFVALSMGAPPMLAALILAFVSNLNVCLTHYGSGSAPVLFSSGFVSVKEWWTVGLVSSVILIFIWSVSGAIWWKVISLY